MRSGFTGKKNLFVASVPIYVRIYKYTKVVFAVALMFFDGIFGRSQKMQAGNPLHNNTLYKYTLVIIPINIKIFNVIAVVR